MSDPATICPWCSAELPGPGLERCPSCGAGLIGPDAAEVPGVTRVDHEAILNSRSPAQRSRGLMGWLSGEYQSEKPPEAVESYAPPAEDVRREMLRLELVALEAEVLARQAEAAALAADAGETPPVPNDSLDDSVDDTDDDATDTTDGGPNEAPDAPVTPAAG
ncbi:MAG: hypothetical protein HW391_1472 [Chloroflexi bacterium]|nr:hypothetical protein [Chloroflexota bacterium]